MKKVTLEWYEVRMAAMVAVERRIQAMEKSFKGFQRYNLTCRTQSEKWGNEIESTMAEAATAKGLGIFWNGSINTFKNHADLLEDIEVRWTDKTDGKLIVRPDDADSKWYILTIGETPEFEIRGAIQGREAKQERWLTNPGKGEPAYFVPQTELKTDLIRKIFRANDLMNNSKQNEQNEVEKPTEVELEKPTEVEKPNNVKSILDRVKERMAAND